MVVPCPEVDFIITEKDILREDEVVFPIRVLKFLGVETLLLSNAAGGMNAAFRVGDLMIIRDHISLFTVNPLLGKNDPGLGTRFPDMSEPYNKQLIGKAKSGRRAGWRSSCSREGVYAGVTGPSFETRAEYKLLHIAGGDAVGMSTVQEVIAARHLGLAVFAMSVITDLGIREEDNRITHEEVLQAAAAAEPKLAAIFKALIGELWKSDERRRALRGRADGQRPARRSNINFLITADDHLMSNLSGIFSTLKGRRIITAGVLMILLLWGVRYLLLAQQIRCNGLAAVVAERG